MIGSLYRLSVTAIVLQINILCLTMCAASPGASVSWTGFAVFGVSGLAGQTTPN